APRNPPPSTRVLLRQRAAFPRCHSTPPAASAGPLSRREFQCAARAVGEHLRPAARGLHQTPGRPALEPRDPAAPEALCVWLPPCCRCFGHLQPSVPHL